MGGSCVPKNNNKMDSTIDLHGLFATAVLKLGHASTSDLINSTYRLSAPDMHVLREPLTPPTLV